MRNRKNPLLISLVTLVAFALIIPSVVPADSTKLSVTPQKNSAAVGDTFSIDIYVTDVTDLWGYTVVLNYTTNVLTATLSTPSTDFPDVSINMINDAEGWVWVEASLPMGTNVGLNGSRTLVTIQFSVDAIGESSLNIDRDLTVLITAAGVIISYREHNLTIVDGSFTTTVVEVHDVAVTNVTASKTKVAPGETVSIGVTVANEGDFAETFNLTVSYDGTVIGTKKDVSLAVEGTTTVSFTWSTSGLPEGSYHIRAEAVVDTDDNNAANNWKTVTIIIGNIHDIAVTNVTTSKTKVAPGETVSIDVTVANLGDFTETFNLTVSYDGTVIGTKTSVSLAVGGTTTLSFSWDTKGFLEGIYHIRAEAVVDTDDNLTNNARDLADIITLKAEGARAPDIFPYVVAAGVAIVIVGAVGFYTLKVRKPKPT